MLTYQGFEITESVDGYDTRFALWVFKNSVQFCFDSWDPATEEILFLHDTAGLESYLAKLTMRNLPNPHPTAVAYFTQANLLSEDGRFREPDDDSWAGPPSPIVQSDSPSDDIEVNLKRDSPYDIPEEEPTRREDASQPHP